MFSKVKKKKKLNDDIFFFDNKQIIFHLWNTIFYFKESLQIFKNFGL